MVFRRKKNETNLDKIRTFFMPKKGWSRPYSYLFHRVKRRSGAPHHIALGVAVGAGISFTPFLGLHLLIGFALCKLLKADVIGMAVGTAVGNPWTFPIIWWQTYSIGNKILHMNTEHVSALEETGLVRTMMTKPIDLIVPMSAGGALLGIIFGVSFYYFSYWLVNRYRDIRQRQLSIRRNFLNKRLERFEKKHPEYTPEIIDNDGGDV